MLVLPRVVSVSKKMKCLPVIIFRKSGLTRFAVLGMYRNSYESLFNMEEYAGGSMAGAGRTKTDGSFAAVFNPIAITGSFFLMLSIPHSIPTELPAGGRTEMTGFQRCLKVIDEDHFVEPRKWDKTLDLVATWSNQSDPCRLVLRSVKSDDTLAQIDVAGC